ncbi:hypothetical protein MKW98_032317 [Papaver atlanticum]|uniref:Uncharacterized protein n=1 Tax=Papaver atlanticum TaxID=357466 RepID=A0AAD4XEB6_9MAGN|nr:hypothetical protein MKW98_032317 [Papaver atlanticum]
MGFWCFSRCCLIICLSISCTLIFAGGIASLLTFLCQVPYDNIKFHVIDASLTKFYLTNDDILHYNLGRISYPRIHSNPSCYGNDLPWVPLPSFLQGTKNTTMLYSVFQGQTSFKLRGSNLKDINDDQRDGSYSISLYLYIATQLKFAGGGKSVLRDFVVNCGLFRLHLLGSSSSNNQTGIGGLFKTKRCENYPRDQTYDDTFY